MRYVGLDVHLKTSTLCILDEVGRHVKTLTVRGTRLRLLDELAKVPAPFAVCFEASCGYGWLYDRLRPLASRVVVAHPGQLRLIFRSKRKNDRIDAMRLAKLLFLNEVPPAYVPALEVRSWRALVEFRQGVLGQRVAVKNRLRALLRSHGIASPRSLWTKPGRTWLRAVELPTAWDDLQRDQGLQQLASLNRQLRKIDKQLDRFGGKQPSVCLLQTIPGIGPRTAEAVAAYIDDPHRFSRSKQVGSYFGLVPSQDASAGINRLGHVTRLGPSTVRRLLAEAAWQAIRHSPRAAAYYQRIRRDDPDRKKIALVATAHWLLRVMHAMLRTGEMWREAG